MYPFMTLTVHFDTLIQINHQDLPVNVSTALRDCLSVYLHVFLLFNHKDLPVTTATCVPTHRCTCSGPYLFIFILKFRLSTKTTPVHQYTFSVCLFLFGITSTSLFLFGIISTITFQLICWGTYTHHLPENKFTCLSSCFSFV